MSIPHYRLFIDGEWVDSPERYEIRSPATGELVATVAKGGTQHVDQAVAAAKAAHASGVWRTKAPEERADLLNAVAALPAALGNIGHSNALVVDGAHAADGRSRSRGVNRSPASDPVTRAELPLFTFAPFAPF